MAEKWLRSLGTTLPDLLGVSDEGNLQFDDLRLPEEVARGYALRKTETAGKIDELAPTEYPGRVRAGVKAFQARQREKAGPELGDDSVGGGVSSSDDIVRACNVIRCMGEELAQLVVSALVRARKDSDLQIGLQSELLEMLGPERIDTVQMVLNNREAVFRDLMSELEHLQTLDENAAKMPANIGTTIRVTTASEKKSRKEQSKSRHRTETKELSRQTDYLRGLANEEEKKKRKVEEQTTIFKKEYTASDVKEVLKTLSAETTYTEHPGYVEVVMPMPPRPTINKKDLVPIADLPAWAQLPFSSGGSHGAITHLNQIQSKIFQTAFYSSENVLVSAPTGAGKTVCALLTMLQEIGKHVTPSGTLLKEEFKMVYVCPMKALAQEMVTTFGKKLAPYNLIVKECTGDQQLTKKEMAECHLIITTPEKWDVITRKKTEALVDKTNLVIFDEIHLLNEDRGPVIEVLGMSPHHHPPPL